jgi:rfaE bifunctional protein kinase chain/domain
MSDPFKGQPDEIKESPDKQEIKENKDASSNTPFSDISLAQGKSLPKETDVQAERQLGKLELELKPHANFTFTLGGKAPFAIRKAEIPFMEREKHLTELKPLISNFLNDTKSIADETISELEQREIERSRNNLDNAASKDEVVANALHLARLYQHMRYIEEAKKAIDLSLGLDPENNTVKQVFKELERMHPADATVSATKQQNEIVEPLSKSNLRKRILSLTGGRIIVLGDLLIDELLEGKPERISREAPVLILEHVNTELIPGGAANTANNIAHLGGACHAIGVCGVDEYANKLAKLFDKAQITYDLVQDPSRPTTVKTRILSKSHSFKQQLLRLDRISHESVDTDVQAKLIEKLKTNAGKYKAIVLSDYRGGVIADAIIQQCRAIARENNVLIIVDAQDDFTRFQNVSLLTPNQPDVEAAVGFPITSKDDLQKAGEELLLLTGAEAILITRGKDGMTLFQNKKPMIELPALNKSEVFDVTGAGDTVVATMALALVTGSTYLEAMALGNLAAGIVVKKPGTATTNQKEMLETLDMLKLPE